MTWDGDISQMGKLADRIADLASVPSRAAKTASKGIYDLMVDEFRSGDDPYGTAWEPLAEATIEKGRTDPPLIDTGAMFDSLRVAPRRGAGIAITIDHPAAPHQTGWSGSRGEGPARPILPQRGELPEAWEDVIERAVDKAVRRGGSQ